MKFLLDANMPYSVKKLFLKPEEVLHVRDINLGNASDADIIAYAVQESAVVVIVAAGYFLFMHQFCEAVADDLIVCTNGIDYYGLI